jgi:hypothetical protein
MIAPGSAICDTGTVDGGGDGEGEEGIDMIVVDEV